MPFIRNSIPEAIKVHETYDLFSTEHSYYTVKLSSDVYIQDSYNTLFFNEYDHYFKLILVSVSCMYTWYPIRLYITPPVYKPSA